MLIYHHGTLSPFSKKFLELIVMDLQVKMNANAVSANVQDHGKVVDRKKCRVQCNYCAKRMSGFSRLRYHLGRIKGDVAPCGAVPEEVKELMKSKLLELKKSILGKEVGLLEHPDLPWKRKLHSSPSAIDHRKIQTTLKAGSNCRNNVQNSVSENGITKEVSSSNGRSDSQKVMDHKEKEDSSSRQVKKSIGRFFYELGIDLSAATSPSFQRLINATLAHGQIGYKLPSCEDLKGWILKEEVKEMQQYVKDVRNSWENTGCSILLDGWMDQKGRNLINVLVDSPKGTIYVRSCDISGYIADVDALQSFIGQLIEEVGVENVVQIITNSTSDYMAAADQRFMEKFRTVFWTVSASHCIELMLEKIGLMDHSRRILDKAKAITKFIHSHATVLKLMRKYTSANNLVKPSKIKLAKPILTLETMVSEKDNLQNMFVSSGWNSLSWASREEGKRIAELVMDPAFWTGVRMVLKATIPLVQVLRWFSGGDDKSQMGYIYDKMDQAKEAIAKAFKHKKSQYMPFWEVIDEIWNKHLHSPLHSTGYYLNPHFFYSSDFHCDAEVASGLLCCIVRLVPDLHVQDVIGLQIGKYLSAEGAFALGSAIDKRVNIPPG